MASENKNLLKHKAAKTVLVSQEICLVRSLCDNSELTRQKALRKVSNWLKNRSNGCVELNEYDYSRLWKGLYYCLWMAAKPLYQEEVVNTICQLVNCFSNFKDVVNFTKSFLYIFGLEWGGLDQNRVDKFLMLLRRMIRQVFFALLKEDWNQTYVDEIATCYKKSFKKLPDGVIHNLSEFYLIELSKVGRKTLNSKVVLDLVRPFAEYMATLTNGPMIFHITSNVFLNLIRLSEKGVEHKSRFQAWRDRGFPEGTIEVIAKKNTADSASDDEESDDDEMNGDILDPRAGNVDVKLSIINCDYHQFLNLFESLKYLETTSSKARKQINVLINKFSTLVAGQYPLGLQKFENPEKPNFEKVIDQTAKDLIDFEEETLIDDSDVDPSNHKQISDIQMKYLKSSRHNSLGVWEVTPVKENTVVNKKLRASRDSLSLFSSEWVVVEKEKEVNSDQLKDEMETDFNSKKINNKRVKRKRLLSNINVSNEELNGYDSESKSEGISNYSLAKEDESIINVESNENIMHVDFSHNNQTNELSRVDNDWSDSQENSETVIVIKSNRKRKRQILKKNDDGNNSILTNGYLTPKAKQDSSPLVTPVNNVSNTSGSKSVSSSAKRKRVAFLLTANTVQEAREYQRIVRNNPVIHFDSEKKPTQPIFKDKGIKSPINPFYRRKGFTSV